MTTDEIKAKIAKLDDRIFPTMSESQKPIVLGNHAIERATYELALQVARVGDILTKFWEWERG